MIIPLPRAGEEGPASKKREVRGSLIVGTVRREISPHAPRLRRDATDAERLLWSKLRSRQLEGWKFRRQVTIGSYIVDFLCWDAALVVEVDGSQHSEDVDAHRTALLNGAGYRVVRFWNNDVLQNMDGVLEDLLTILAQQGSRRPSPSQS